MKRSQYPNVPKKPKPTKDLTLHKPQVVPLVIWSNSVYSNGAPIPNDVVQSSVASNSELLLERLSLQERVGSSVTGFHDSFRKSTKKKLVQEKKLYSSSAIESLICDEELRLREELGGEIEKELERELMDGIMVLVRRLSELKAKQFLREVREEAQILMRKRDATRKKSVGVKEMKGREFGCGCGVEDVGSEGWEERVVMAPYITCEEGGLI